MWLLYSSEVEDGLHISKNSHEQDLFWNFFYQAVIHYPLHPLPSSSLLVAPIL
jgi:hypothetical protein